MIAALIAAVAVVSAASADMMPVSSVDVEHRQTIPVYYPVNPQNANPLDPFVCLGVPDLDLRAVGCLPDSSPNGGQASETKSARILTDEQNSLTLGLYALMGLGLCRSAPWMRKLSLVSIPDWYHAGGPFQIGHSLVVAPDCRCPAPVCGFIQADLRVEDSIPRYRQKVMVSLWRKAQYTPAVLASRGPPSIP